MYNRGFIWRSVVKLMMVGFAQSRFHFVAYGDWGTPTQDLRDTISSINRVSPNRLFNLLMGDNFYPGGVTSVLDSQFSIFTDVVLRDTELVHHMVLGNHDYMSNVSAQIEYSQINSYWDLPNNYYRRIHSSEGVNVCLIVIDTVKWDPSQVAWIEEQLRSRECDTQTAWTIVSGHYPIWTSADYTDSLKLKTDLVPLLHKYGVQLYLCGHEHGHAVFYDGQVVQVYSGAPANPRRLHFKKHSQQIWGLAGKDVAGYIRLFVTDSAVDISITSSRSDRDFVTFSLTRGGTAKSMFDHINWTSEFSDTSAAYLPRLPASDSNFTTKCAANLLDQFTLVGLAMSIYG